MDSKRFDAWTRGLGSRRIAFGAFAGLGLALTIGPNGVETKRKRRKRKKRKNKNQRQAPPGPPPPPTCVDGIQNGNETDVDCGGSCPRCVNGKACATRNDCLSGVCLGGTCQPCTNTDQCALDPNGQCACEATANAGLVCNPSAESIDVLSCAACPVNTNCFAGFASFFCVRACQGA